MNKVYMYSDMFLPTFPYLELPLYHYLQGQGVDVHYVLHKNDVRLTTPELAKTFEKLNLIPISSASRVVKIMDKKGMLVSRFAYKGPGGKAAQVARNAGRIVFMYDPSGIDIRVRQCPAHYLTAKSKLMKKAVLKKFPNAYKNIFTTGTIHYDAAAITQVNRTEFMKSYGLDPNKKLAILTPANPGELGHQKGVDNEYSKIIDIVRNKCPDYEIAVKAHPLDYTASMPSQPGIVHKNQHYEGKHSWDKFAPGITVIKAEEGYRAIKACDVVLNVRSSIAMETCLFPKPLVNINSDQYTTNWPHDTNIMMGIKMKDLKRVLNTNAYVFDAESVEYCKEYAKKYCYSDDGKAYIRTANAIKKVAECKI